MKSIIQICLFVTLLVAVHASGRTPPTPRPRRPDACELAFANCKFRFAGSSTLPTFQIGFPDMAFTPQIVSSTRGERVGIFNSNGVEPQFIAADGTATDITELGNGFTPTQFKPFAIPERIASGVGHETFQGNVALATGQCVRVFFTAYQKLESMGPPTVMTNINLTPQEAVRMQACVVFRTA